LIILGYKEHGYSALAEFRFHFISLVIPFYCLSARLSGEEWLRFSCRVFWLIALLVVPVIAISLTEGARPFSPGHRILSASTHLWLLISLILLMVPGLVAKGFVEKFIAWLVGGGYIFLILSDAHRSVWLASAAILITILVLGHDEFRALRIITALLCLTIVPLLIFVLIEGETAISEFIVSRTNAFLAPSADATASWRMRIWGAAWEVIKANPIMGIGLGRYSDDVWLLLDSPPKGPNLHNFYISLLLKGGVVLAVLYGWYMVNLGWAFVKLRKDVAPRWHVVFVLGLASLFGMLVFQIAYGVSGVFMLFVGALLAFVLASNRVNGEPNQS